MRIVPWPIQNGGGWKMREVGLGIQDFEKIRKNHQFYVDKTDFIRQWYYKNDDITLITRPSRFGKTLTVDMMNCFFSIDYANREDLFSGLAVSNNAELMAMQGTIPAVHIMETLRVLFSETLKENRNMDRALITGNTRIAKESLFSDMNNLAVYSVLSGGYETSFGFTKNEMDQILDEYKLTDKEKEVKYWYDGFTIREREGIYNPWSVTSFLARREFPPEAYWTQSGGFALVDQLIRRGDLELHELLQILIDGGSITTELSDDLVFTELDSDSCDTIITNHKIFN